MSRRSLLLHTVPWVLSLAGVAWWVSQQRAPTLPHSAGALAALTGALCLYVVATLARAERWHQILRRSNVEAARTDSYALTTVGYMGNNVLPARGGELLRVFLLAPRARTGRGGVLGTILAERLLDAAALGLLFVVLAYGLLRGVSVPGGRLVVVLAIVAAVLVAAVVAGVVLLRRPAVRRRLEHLVRALAGPTRRLASWHGAGLLLLSLGIWALEATVYLTVGDAADLHMSLLSALYVVAFTNLFALIPAAPGYIGTFDAAVIFAVKAVGGASALVVSYLLLLRFVLFVPITLVGLVVLAARYGGWSRYRAARLAARRGTELPVVAPDAAS